MISEMLKTELNAMKLFSGETYEDIIKDLIDDRKFLNEETLKEIEQAKKEADEGKIVSFEAIKKKMRANV